MGRVVVVSDSNMIATQVIDVSRVPDIGCDN
jgi:hypothetical protein